MLALQLLTPLNFALYCANEAGSLRNRTACDLVEDRSNSNAQNRKMQVCTGKRQCDISWQLSCCLCNLNNAVCSTFWVNNGLVFFFFKLRKMKSSSVQLQQPFTLPSIINTVRTFYLQFCSIHCFHFSRQTIPFTWQWEKIFPPSKDEWATGLGQWQTHTDVPFLSSPATGSASKNENRLKMIHSGFAG